MKIFIVFAAVVSLLYSCSSRDEKMCSCLEAGDKLNEFSAKVLQGQANQADVKKMKKLKAEKTKKCVDFQTMSGEEMLKKKATCGE